MISSKGCIGFSKSFGENSGKGEYRKGALGALGLRYTFVGLVTWAPEPPRPAHHSPHVSFYLFMVFGKSFK